jgi:plastocyanin
MRKPLALLLAVAAVAAALIAVPAYSASKTVQVRDNTFRPGSLSVRRGDTVVFRWAGRNPHNVRVEEGPRTFQSRVQTRGAYRARISRRGTYRLVCDIHPGMRMTLRAR